jgi:hypothetical protein
VAAERLGTSTGALAERVLGNALFYRGETVDGLAWMDRMVEVARDSGDDSLLAHACYMRSVAEISVGDHDGAGDWPPMATMPRNDAAGRPRWPRPRTPPGCPASPTTPTGRSSSS